MRIILMLAALFIAAPAFAHDCCCGGMERLSAGTVKRLELRQLDINANEARQMFKAYGNLLDGMALDSPWYPGVKQAYEHWLNLLEQLQGEAIDAATWEMIDADMDEALDAAYRRVK